MSAHFYVYEHWRPDTNQCFYVGKGTRNRAWALGSRTPYHKRIRAKLKDAGLEVDVRIIADDLLEADAFKREIDLIALYRERGHRLVNRTNGGEGASGLLCTPERREKISRANRGRKLTEEHRAKLSSWVRTEETRRKISESGRGRQSRLGMTHSAETRARLKELATRNIDKFKTFSHLGPEASSKRVLCLDDGKLFPSASAAARHYSLNRSSIIELCNGNGGRRKSVGGRVFEYIVEESKLGVC